MHTHVLLVEDNPGDVALIEASLSEAAPGTVTLHPVQRIAQGVELLRRTPIDAILLDLSLPDSDGLAALGRAQSEAPEIPVLILTGLDDPEMAARALRAGAQDYLVKDQADGRMLVRSLRFAIERKRAEQARTAEAEVFRAVERSLPFGVAAVDLKGRQIYVNSRFCEMVGWAREELAGARPPFPYWPMENMLSAGGWARAASGPLHVRLRTRTGEPLSLRLRVQPLKSPLGESMGWLQIFEPCGTE